MVYGSNDRRGGQSRFQSNRGGFQNSRPRTDKYEANFDVPDTNWSRETLVHFQKNFYHETETCKKRSEADIRAFREENQIVVVGTAIPKPVLSFDECVFPESVYQVIRNNNWTAPTPIQAQGWPMALSGQDVVGIAQTGSGKTAAFTLPGIVHLLAQKPVVRGEGPIVLILVPTRELASQVLKVAEEFTEQLNLRCAVCYGGADKFPQARKLRESPQIVIATPGRLLDFLQNKTTNLKRCTYLVLDEADRMLDMGFEPQIRKILKQIRPDRQTVMWSATWPKEVQTLAREFMNNYQQVNIGSITLHANPNIKQIIEVVQEQEKERKIVPLVKGFQTERTIIFTQTKKTADDLFHALRRAGVRVVVMHGNKAQKDREYVLEQFRTGQAHVLVATDVASRGLDIDDIQFVVNYDMPSSTEDYIHRIGRTARSDKHGTSYSFYTRNNSKLTRSLIEILKEAKQDINPELYNLMGYGGGYGDRRGGGGRGRYQRGGQSSYGSDRGNSYGGGSDRGNSRFNGGRGSSFGSRPGEAPKRTRFDNPSGNGEQDSSSGPKRSRFSDNPSSSYQNGTDQTAPYHANHLLRSHDPADHCAAEPPQQSRPYQASRGSHGNQAANQYNGGAPNSSGNQGQSGRILDPTGYYFWDGAKWELLPQYKQ